MSPAKFGTTIIRVHSAAIKRHQAPSRAIKRNREQASAIESNQAQSRAIKSHREQSSAITEGHLRSVHSHVCQLALEHVAVSHERDELREHTRRLWLGVHHGGRGARAVPGGGDGECLKQSEHSLGSHQKSSEVIRGHQRSSEVVRGLQRSSEVIRGPHLGLAFIKGLEDHRVLVLLATGVAALVPHPGIPEGAQSEPIWEAIRGHQRSSEAI
jgi:hypothetical protein